MKPVLRIFSSLGPGLIIASVCLGPGSVTTSSKIGAQYGYELIWVVVASSAAMAMYTVMGARFGATQERSFLQAIANSYGRWFAALIGLSAFLMSSSFQFGNNLGVATAMTEITGISEQVWPFVFTGISLAFVLGAKDLYQVVEKLMAALVLVMIFAFFANLVVARPDLGAATKGLIPNAPKGATDTIAAMVGTTFVLHACLYQAYLVQQKGWSLADVRKSMWDSLVGIGFLGVISILIMMTSAAALRPRDIQVNTAADMARQLESLFGPYAKIIFCLGLWAAAFSSISVNAIIGGGLLSDGLGIGRRMDQGWPRAFALIIMTVGMVIAVFFRGNIVQALVLAQAATLLAVPAVALGLFLMLNNRKVMGPHVNNAWQNVIAVFGLGLILVMSYATYQKLIGEIRKATVGSEKPQADSSRGARIPSGRNRGLRARFDASPPRGRVHGTSLQRTPGGLSTSVPIASHHDKVVSDEFLSRSAGCRRGGPGRFVPGVRAVWFRPLDVCARIVAERAGTEIRATGPKLGAAELKRELDERRGGGIGIRASRLLQADATAGWSERRVA